MKLSYLIAVLTSSATTASPLLSLNVGGVGVNVGSGGTLLAVNLSPTATSSANPKLSTMTAAPTTTSKTYPTALPSTFSAPVQGSGALSLSNLPAMPAVIDKTLSGALDAVYGLMSGICSSDYKCTITVAGSIQSLLVDGDKYSASSSISAWCDAGRCYGSAEIPVTATAPFTVTCDQLTGTSACSATISGAANAIFTNGQQLELWGWLTPAGYCQDGVCMASVTAFGDPMY